jgi:hypothetical protein
MNNSPVNLSTIVYSREKPENKPNPRSQTIMPFPQGQNQLASTQSRVIAAILPAILLLATVVIFVADLVILTVEAGEAARHDCRILLGKPTPVAHTVASPATIALTCRECIAALQARGISRRSGGRLLNTQEMNALLN